MLVDQLQSLSTSLICDVLSSKTDSSWFYCSLMNISGGGLRDLDQINFQSSFLKKSCFLIYAMSFTPNLLLMSLSSSLFIRDLTSIDRQLGNRSFPFFIFQKRVSRHSLKKGGQPTTISQSTHPMPQMSEEKLTPFFSSISGDKQAGLPQKDVAKLLSRLSPKSVSLMQPSCEMSIFSGFRSRQRILFLCRYQTARISWEMINLAVFSDSFSLTLSSYPRSPLEQLSRAMYRFVGVWKAQQSLMMKEDSTLLRMLASPTAYFSCFLEMSRFLFSTFSAYILLVFLYLARYTCPKAPFPKMFSTQKSSQEIEAFFYSILNSETTYTLWSEFFLNLNLLVSISLGWFYSPQFCSSTDQQLLGGADRQMALFGYIMLPKTIQLYLRLSY